VSLVQVSGGAHIDPDHVIAIRTHPTSGNAIIDMRGAPIVITNWPTYRVVDALRQAGQVTSEATP
jgi:hypothetical protein